MRRNRISITVFELDEIVREVLTYPYSRVLEFAESKRLYSTQLTDAAHSKENR